MYYPSSENKGVISFAVTAKLICVFVFAYADCWFSHEAAQTKLNEHGWLVVVVWGTVADLEGVQGEFQDKLCDIRKTNPPFSIFKCPHNSEILNPSLGYHIIMITACNCANSQILSPE